MGTREVTSEGLLRLGVRVSNRVEIERKVRVEREKDATKGVLELLTQ